MELYIRALAMYPVAVILYGVLIVLDFVLYWLSSRVQFTKLTFVSNILEPDGWKISFPLSISRCYEHKAKGQPNKLPILIMSCNVLVNIISMFVTSYTVADKDIKCYIFINGLLLLVAVLLWYSRCRDSLGQIKHEEYLRLIELCYCPTDPQCTMLLFVDHLGSVYSFLATGTFRWKLNSYYKCTCYDNYIMSLDPCITYNPDDICFNNSESINSNINWFLYDTPRLCGWLSILCSELAILLHSYVFIAASFCFLLTVIATMPRATDKELYCSCRRKTAEYKDLPTDCAFTYVLLDDRGVPYYYCTDDKTALDIGSTYKVHIHGRLIEYVLYESEITPEVMYSPPQGVGGLYVVMCIWFLGCIALELIGFELYAMLSVVPLVFLTIALLKYNKRGEL